MEPEAPKTLFEQLEQMRQLYAEVADADQRTTENYAWLIVKALSGELLVADSVRSRQYLAEAMHLSLPRPSKVYSALLGAACKMAQRFPEFRFGAFLKMWDLRNLRPDDYLNVTVGDGKAIPALARRVAKAYMHALLLHPADEIPTEHLQQLRNILDEMRYLRPHVMMVTKVTPVKMQRGTMYVARLIDAYGLEVTFCPVADLKPHPLHASKDARHYVNVGQLYDVLLRKKEPGEQSRNLEAKLNVEAAYLSSAAFGEGYPVAVGYVESYDAAHQYYHVYDGQSRHFVADAASENLGRYGRPTVNVGDYVRFAPIIPASRTPDGKVFKRAHILYTYTRAEGPQAFGLRAARVVQVDMARKFYRWELIDSSRPIVEDGTTEPAFTSGFVSFGEDRAPHEGAAALPAVGQTVQIIVYLKRGKDKQKRPHVVHVEESKN